MRRANKTATRRATTLNQQQQQQQQTVPAIQPPPAPAQQQLPQNAPALMDVDDQAFAAMEAQYGGWVDPSLTTDWTGSAALLDAPTYGDWGTGTNASWTTNPAPAAEGMWGAAPDAGPQWFDGAAMNSSAVGEEAMFLNAMQGGLDEWL